MGVIFGFLLAVVLGLAFIFLFWGSSVTGEWSSATVEAEMPTPTAIVMPAMTPTPTPTPIGSPTP